VINLYTTIAAAPIAASTLESWSRTALNLTIDAAMAGVFLAIGLCLWRILRGPTVVDRGIAADTLSLEVIGLAILMAVRMNRVAGFDVVLIIALLGFVSTLAFAQYVGRKGTVE